MPKAATKKTALPLNELRKLFLYNAETGKLVWAVKRNSFAGKVKPGVDAGTVDKHGYLMIITGGLTYPAHRLAWYLHYGRWPTGQIDHRNMVPLDNRIKNLREASRSDQRGNQRVRSDSLLGIKGIGQTRTGGFYARINKHGVRHNLGVFPTAIEASAAYWTAAQKLFGEFARR